jgi:hypothetical protein
MMPISDLGVIFVQRVLGTCLDEEEQLPDAHPATPTVGYLVKRSHAVNDISDVSRDRALERDDETLTRCLWQNGEKGVAHVRPSPPPFSRIRNILVRRHTSSLHARSHTGVNQFPPGADRPRYLQNTQLALRLFLNWEARLTALELQVPVCGAELVPVEVALL